MFLYQITSEIISCFICCLHHFTLIFVCLLLRSFG
uniref:Uncharacterized protein n=1 Tax=Arundo donax TaxID=35708 RepID=A0A0A8ZRX5_ARUDO